MRNTWFRSDDHFDHKNIIKYCNRPFINPIYPDLSGEPGPDNTDRRRFDHLAMNEAMLDYHNELVAPEDDVFDLGDFAFGRDATEESVRSHLRRMNGQIHFLWGNHDKILKRVLQAQPGLVTWFSQEGLKDDRHNPIVEFKQGDVDIILCHYAMKVWNHSHKGSMHLYGHSHGTLPEGPELSFDVGVDCTNFRPMHLDDVLSRMNSKKKKLEAAAKPWIPIKE